MTDAGPLRLFLCGDVMTGRGIDQILPHPAPPRLYERYVTSAQDYVRIAETRHGEIPRKVDWSYIWGAALEAFEHMRPDARIVNLETAVTLNKDAADKGINYRMNPANMPVLSAAGVDVCTLANNHVLDWGLTGMEETLDSVEAAGIAVCGAGRHLREAARPAILNHGQGGRLLVFGYAHGSAGVPRGWAATEQRPGVNLLPDLSPATAKKLAAAVAMWRGPGDIAVVSIHWGGNWGFEVPADQTAFAHALIDAGVSVVHGHSSHHAKGLERHRDGLVIYGAGDFVNDYEGIGGHGEYRDDLVLMYWPEIDAANGAVTACRMTPLRLRNMRLNRPSDSERRWLAETLDRESRTFGTGVELAGDGLLTVEKA
jgi:poly-gamma-glutamate synthesis protein (capsule biosynthesis protein)